MIGTLLSKVFGSQNDRLLKKYKPLVAQINALEPEIAALSDEALKAKTPAFRDRLKKGETLDQILPEAFAVVRETAKRTTKMRPFDVQLIGGIALHRGYIAEMATGEGKTLVATLPVYLNALSGKGVHMVTVNDYLAKRDREWMGPIYEFLGLSVGVIQHNMPVRERQQAYASDITFGTNNEYGFDYLKDNMVSQKHHRVQRELNFCVIDEVDSILVDESRTPLIISGPAEQSTDLYYRLDRLIPNLQPDDYSIEEKTKTVTLTDSGVKRCEGFLKIDNLYDPNHVELVHHVNQALRAHKLFKRDVDYVVQKGEVIIVDEFTGRLMPGRRFSDGLHQALEAREKVNIERENQTLASITFQNFFRMYKKLSGMTGTAVTEAQEFYEIYKLPVLAIPTNRPMARNNQSDVIYRTEREKHNAIVKQIGEINKIGRPVLVGTISIEKSEELSGFLRRSGIAHTVLNAKYHEKEAEIIKLAGQRGAVTIATNMAGRGTDIVLGQGVADLGGLHVLGTERHESRRIDNQLRGRSGRQGDPGSSQFFLSLEDDLMRIFGSDRISGLMQKLGMEEGQDIQHPFVTRAIETAQTRVESRNFEIRKQLLKFDDVMNQQRVAIYDERYRIITGESLKSYYHDIVAEIVDDTSAGLKKALQQQGDDDEETRQKAIFDYLQNIFNIKVSTLDVGDAEQFKNDIQKRILATYEEKEKAFGAEMLRNIERMILLDVVDAKWKDHLRHMDELREGIGLRAYGQQDPIVAYRHEGFAMFEEMTRKIKEDAISFLFRAQPLQAKPIEAPREELPLAGLQMLHPDVAAPPPASAKQPLPLTPQTNPKANNHAPEHAEKVGRNDPCPCGSGKKYKKCCGA